MNDYLSNLAARSLNLVELIQPRLKSLFEPSLERTRPVYEDSSYPETMEGQHSPNLAKPEVPVPAPSSDRRSVPLQIPEIDLSQALDLRRQRPGQLTTTPNRRQQVPLPAAFESAEMRLEWPSRQVLSEPVQPSIKPPSEQHVKNRSTITSITYTDKVDNGSSQTAVEKRDRTWFEPATPRTLIEPTTSAPTAIVTRPYVRPHIEPAPAFPPEAKQKPASTIQVTIGRIEVRATSPPGQPPQKKRSASPVMSLEEYLRQRTKRGGG